MKKIQNRVVMASYYVPSCIYVESKKNGKSRHKKFHTRNTILSFSVVLYGEFIS